MDIVPMEQYALTLCAKYVLNISIERRRGADLKYKIQKKKSSEFQ